MQLIFRKMLISYMRLGASETKNTTVIKRYDQKRN